MGMRYLRQIDSLRFDIPNVRVWTRELSVQGNFRECDAKGGLIKPGPQPWVDQWNNIHDPGEPMTGKSIAVSNTQPATDVVFKNMGNILHNHGIPVAYWLPNYILDEVSKQDNAIEVMKAELERNRVKAQVVQRELVFADYLAAYKQAKKVAYSSFGQPDPDILEPKMIEAFYQAHPNLVKRSHHKKPEEPNAETTATENAPTEAAPVVEQKKYRKPKASPGRRMKRRFRHKADAAAVQSPQALNLELNSNPAPETQEA